MPRLSGKDFEPQGAPASPGVMARFKQRLFSSSPVVGTAVRPTASTRRRIGFQASLAELLLVNRLKARTQRNQAAEILERAAQIVFVTCKNWFSASDGKAPPHRKPL